MSRRYTYRNTKPAVAETVPVEDVPNFGGFNHYDEAIDEVHALKEGQARRYRFDDPAAGQTFGKAVMDRARKQGRRLHVRIRGEGRLVYAVPAAYSAPKPAARPGRKRKGKGDVEVNDTQNPLPVVSAPVVPAIKPSVPVYVSIPERPDKPIVLYEQGADPLPARAGKGWASSCLSPSGE